MSGAPDEARAPDAAELAVLRRRARELARPAAPAVPDDALEVIEILLGEERFVIETLHVRAVTPARDIAPLPGAPSSHAGITVWRGELLELVDLRAMLGVADDPPAALDRLVVIGDDEERLGLLVGSVVGTARLRAGELQPPTGPASALVRAVSLDAVSLLDASAILALHHRTGETT